MSCKLARQIADPRYRARQPNRHVAALTAPDLEVVVTEGPHWRRKLAPVSAVGQMIVPRASLEARSAASGYSSP